MLVPNHQTMSLNIPEHHNLIYNAMMENMTSSQLNVLQTVQSNKKHRDKAVAYPGILFGGGSTNSVEERGQRGRGSGGGSPLLRGSGGGCNFVQEISFHIVTFS